MKHKIEFARRAAKCAYETIFTYLLLLFIMVIFAKKQPDIFMLPAIGIIFICSYMIRETAANYLILCVGHMIMAVVMAAIPFYAVIKVSLIIIVLSYLLPESYAYAKRMSVLKPMDGVPWPTILISLVFYIFGAAVGSEYMMVRVHYSVVLLLAITLVMIYLEGVLKYIRCTADVSGVPIKTIINANTKIVAFIIMGIIVLMLAGNLFDYKDGFSYIENIALMILKVIFGCMILFWTILSKLLSGGARQTGIYEETREAVNTSFSENETGTIFFILFAVLLVILLLYLLYKILRVVLAKLLEARVYHNDVVECLQNIPVAEEKINIQKRKSIIHSKEDYFRKMYKDYVKSHLYEEDINPYLTCDEIKRELYERHLIDAEEVTKLYSSVRYGGRQVDRKLIKEMKSQIS